MTRRANGEQEMVMKFLQLDCNGKLILWFLQWETTHRWFLYHLATLKPVRELIRDIKRIGASLRNIYILNTSKTANSCECIEQSVADTRQGVDLHLGDWAKG
jgi:hypothetical protein